MFDPDRPRMTARRVLKNVKLPPLKPSAPVGKFSSRDLARAALLSALRREGDWWGEPLLARWATSRSLTPGQARELMEDLVVQERVEEAWGGVCPRWRAKGGT